MSRCLGVYVCMYVCMHVCMCVCAFVYVHVHVYVYYVCICMCVCTYVRIRIYGWMDGWIDRCMLCFLSTRIQQNSPNAGASALAIRF